SLFYLIFFFLFFFFSSRRRHTRSYGDWSSDVCSSDLHYLDVHIAYRRACLNAIEYLKKFGYTGEQAYAILGTAPVQGHISGIVRSEERRVGKECRSRWAREN